MPEQVIVRLKITSVVHEPEFISEVLGLPFDRGWKIGDFRPHTTIREKFNGWVLGSGLEDTVSINEQIVALLNRCGSIGESVATSLSGDNIEVSCVIYSDSTPPLNFDSQTLAGISALGASLDIDLYL